MSQDTPFQNQTSTPSQIDPPESGTQQVPPAAPPSKPDVVELNSRQEAAILDLIQKFFEANRAARLEEIRRVQLNREFYRGNQNIFWNAEARRWQRVTSSGLQTKSESDPAKQRFDYVSNIFSSTTDKVVSFLSNNAPKVRFVPQSVRSEEDVVTAKVASKIAKFVEDNNDVQNLRIQMCQYLCLDGVACAYVRYVEDGERFGYDSIPIIEQSLGELAPAAISCGQCSYKEDLPEAPTADFAAPCPQCAKPLGPADTMPAVMGPVDQVTGHERRAKGQEVITIYGGLETQRPFFARTIGDFPIMQLELEVPRAKLKVVYPKKAKLLVEDQTPSDEGGAQLVARYARMSTSATASGRWVGGGHSQNLITFRRVWVANWAFFDIEDDDLANELYGLFPDGGYFAIAGDHILEARIENMSGVWTILHARPGEGQIREGIMHPMIDVQRRYNIEENIMTESFEYNIPTRLINTSMINLNAYQSSGALPGQHMPVAVPPGGTIKDAMSDSPGPSVSPQMINHMEWLFGETTQELVGTNPALFGGATGANDTATGIGIARDQAAGRMGPYLIRMRSFWAKTMENAIECFRKNRTEDVELAVEGSDSEWQADMIHLADLRGNVFCRPDADEAIPKTWSERRTAASTMLESKNPSLQQLLLMPQNIDILENNLGVDEIFLPGQDARIRQLKQIKQMLQNPMPIPPDPIIDQNDIMLEAIREWANSAEGQVALLQNPGGFNAVHVQAEMRMQIQAQAAMAMQAQQAPPPDQGGGPVQ